ncbi:MAG: class I SAM-dependent methyltransferase [Mesorhizobium sp.]
MAEWTGGIHRLVTMPGVYDWIQRLLGGPQAREKIASELFSDATGMSILEIGCGPGTWVPYLPEFKSYLGLDWNEKHIVSARDRYGSDKVQFATADISELRQSENGYDVVLGVGILHHLDDKAARSVLQKSAATLSPGGIYIGLEPVYHRRQNPIAKVLKMLDSGRNIRREDQYRSLLESNFPKVETRVETTIMRVPYSHCLIRAQVA